MHFPIFIFVLNTSGTTFSFLRILGNVISYNLLTIRELPETSSKRVFLFNTMSPEIAACRSKTETKKLAPIILLFITCNNA